MGTALPTACSGGSGMQMERHAAQSDDENLKLKGVRRRVDRQADCEGAAALSGEVDFGASGERHSGQGVIAFSS